MRSSIRARLVAGYIAVVVLLALAWATTTISTTTLRANYTHTVNTVDALSAMVLQGSKLRSDEETGLRGYLLTGRPAFLQPYLSAQRAIPALRHNILVLAAGDTRLTSLLHARAKTAQTWEQWATGVLRQSAPTSFRTAAFIAQQQRGKHLFDQYRTATAELIHYLDTRRQHDLQSSLAMLAGMNALLAGIFASAVGLMLLIGWRTTRAVTQPLERLGHAAAAIGHGDLTQRVAVEGAREFRRLGENMEWMRRQLSNQHALATIVGSTLRLDDVYARFAAGVREVVPYDRLTLIMLDEDGATGAEITYAIGLGADRFGRGTRFAISDTTWQQTYVDREYLIRSDLATLEPHELSRAEQALLAIGVRAQAILPLHAKGQMIGALTLSSTTPDIYNRQNLGAIMALTPLVAAAIDNARLYATLETTNAALGEETRALETAAAELARRATDLERSNEELEQFAYVASHDLQEPLRMIASYSQLLSRRYKGRLDADADDFISYTVDGVTRMQRLINDLLAYSRVGTRGIELVPTDCAVAVEQACANLQAAIDETGARITVDPLPTVLADASQLAQLFQNLIGNAVKFCPHTPQIAVAAVRDDEGWRISVQDNGIGLDPSYAERIFVIFQRLHGKDEYAGTGIGLSICKKIVQRHGGRIWVESQPGQGATFTFTLLAADQVAGEVTGSQEQAA